MDAGFNSVVTVERPDAYLHLEQRNALFRATADNLFDAQYSSEFTDDYCGGTYNLEGDPTHDDLLKFATYIAEQGKGKMAQTNERTPEMAVRELLAATPLAISDAMRIQESYLEKPELKATKLRLSHFNGLIREAASHLPQLGVDELLGHLFDAANLGIRPADMERFGQQQLRLRVHGAQHEYGFIQLAREAGLQWQPATEEEDVDEGIDVHVWTARGKYIPVNVKAAKRQVEAHGSGNASYAMGEDGLITITSGIHTQDYQGRFRIPKHVLRDRAPACQMMFEEIALRRTAFGAGGVAVKRYAVQ